MIHVNLMDVAVSAQKPKNAKPVKPAKPAKVKSTPSHRPSSSLLVFLLLVVMAGGTAWFYLEGGGEQWVQTLLQKTRPQPTPEQAIPQPVAPPPPPQVIAQGPSTAPPAIPVNGAVEEIVRTVRPELFIKPTRTEYRELLPTEKIRYQKRAFSQFLSTLYSMTPESVGFLDLAYKAPDYYFVRGMSLDSKAQAEFIQRIQKASREFKQVSSDSTLPSPEFTVYGTFPSTAISGESFPLVPANELDKEIFALRDLAIAASVKLAGLEKPLSSTYGAYKRILLRTNTQADFPALLKFADSLHKSSLRVGILQFASRPTLSSGMSSSLEFIIYTTP